MPKASTQVSNDFLFARLHGLWSKAVKGELLDKLLHSATPEILQRHLHDLGMDASSRNSFYAGLLHRRRDVLIAMEQLLEPGAADFYKALLARSFFDNLKLAVGHLYMRGERDSIDDMIMDVPEVSAACKAAALKAQTIGDMVQALRLETLPCGAKLVEIFKQLEKDGNVMAAYSAIDCYYFKYTMEAAKGMGLDMAAAACRLLGEEIDITNLGMLFRNIRTYHLKADVLNRIWLEKGNLLSTAKLTELATLERISDALRLLPPEYQKLLQGNVERELYIGENLLWNHLYEQALKMFRDFQHPDRSIVAYPFLIHFECVNIGRIYEGIHFGIPARDMQNMMIGA